MKSRRSHTVVLLLALTCAAPALVGCHGSKGHDEQRAFATPEDAVRALIDAAKAEDLNQVVAIFGPEGKELVDSSDPVTARRNRQVFVAAAGERWHLVDDKDGSKVLVVGNEEWPFPVPLVKGENGWRYDTAAGKEEVIARRIGRNELAAIRLCRTYVAAQKLYAESGHDGQPPGVYATTFGSDAGRQNGLYWPAKHGEKRSPLGDLVAQAALKAGDVDSDRTEPSPFHGYYFKILTSQGNDAPGGAKNYISNSRMSGGFALVAWPAQYDVTGVMSFIVNQNSIVHEQDLGPDTNTVGRKIAVYNPDSSWTAVQ